MFGYVYLLSQALEELIVYYLHPRRVQVDAVNVVVWVHPFVEVTSELVLQRFYVNHILYVRWSIDFVFKSAPYCVCQV